MIVIGKNYLNQQKTIVESYDCPSPEKIWHIKESVLLKTNNDEKLTSPSVCLVYVKIKFYSLYLPKGHVHISLTIYFVCIYLWLFPVITGFAFHNFSYPVESQNKQWNFTL